MDDWCGVVVERLHYKYIVCSGFNKKIKKSEHTFVEQLKLHTLPFKSLGSLRNVLVFHENIHEMSCKMNRKYSQDVDNVINNDF